MSHIRKLDGLVTGYYPGLSHRAVERRPIVPIACLRTSGSGGFRTQSADPLSSLIDARQESIIVNSMLPLFDLDLGGNKLGHMRGLPRFPSTRIFDQLRGALPTSL